MFQFDNSYRNLPTHLYTSQNPIPVKSPSIVCLNKRLLNELGISEATSADVYTGNSIPDGAEPIAQAYAGHQFGHLNILGDGRAILLGEHITPNNERVDIQLKGSGRTPYSRNGDGRGTLYSMLREYLISHAMENLQIPTTKSLAVAETGERVIREEVHKGAVLTRVASSHIRVGTFVYVTMKSTVEELKVFTDYTIARHYPKLQESESPYLAFVKTVMKSQIELLVNWLRVGFIHGVMNTDNMAISGETIDFGPCAFMDNYDPTTVFSSIDTYGRYAFGNQRHIGKWNLARFAEALIPLIHPTEKEAIKLLNELLEGYDSLFEEQYRSMMCAKIGISESSPKAFKLVENLLAIMEKEGFDYTKTFRVLGDENIPELEEWYTEWRELTIDKDLMDRTNPAVIPRNHLVEEALSEAAFKGNYKPFETLYEVLGAPYLNTASDNYKNPPTAVNQSYKTYCGT